MLEVEQKRVMLQKMNAEQEANERCHQEEMEERVRKDNCFWMAYVDTLPQKVIDI